MTDLIRRVSAPSVRIIDGLVVFLIAFWLAVGAWVGFSLWELSGLGATVTESGRTLDDAGRTLQEAGGIPFVGDEIARLGGDVRATAGEIVQQGREVVMYGRRLSVLVGLAVALAPLAPLLMSYVPARVSRFRDTRAIERVLDDPVAAAALDRYLAHRAIALLSADRFRELTDDPWADVRDGRLRALADAELARLGLARPSGMQRRR